MAAFGREAGVIGNVGANELERLGRAAVITSAALAGGFALSAKAAIDWESAFTGVEKTVEGSSQTLSMLEGDLREMAKTLPATHKEIAAVAEAAGQLGIGASDVAEFTRVMIDLGESTNLSAQDAAFALARMVNIMGTAGEDISRLGSSIVELGNNSATTEAEIVDMSIRMAAAGEMAGLSEADVLGFAAALSSVGVEAELGGTALSRVFTAISDAVRDGGDRLTTFANVAGLSIDQFRQAFAEDAAGAITLFITGIDRLAKAGESTTQVFDDLDMMDVRLMRSVKSLASSGDLLTESLKMSAGAWEENTALAEEAERRYGTTASQFGMLRNQIVDLGISFGELLLPAIRVLVGALSGLVEILNDMPTATKVVLGILAGLTAVIVGLAGAATLAAPALAAFSAALGALGISLTGVAAGAFAVLGPIGAVAAAMVAGAAIFGTSGDKVDDYTESVERLASALSEAARGQGNFDEVVASIGKDWLEGLTDQQFDLLQLLGLDATKLREAAQAGKDEFNSVWRDAFADKGIDIPLDFDFTDLDNLKSRLQNLGIDFKGDLESTAGVLTTLIGAAGRLGKVLEDAAKVEWENGVAEGGEYAETLQLAATMATNLETGVTNYSQALAIAADLMDDGKLSGKGFAAALGDVSGAADDAAQTLDDLIDAVTGRFNLFTDYIDAWDAVHGSTEDATESAREYQDAQRQAAQATADLTEAQKAYDEVLKETFADSREATEAIQELMDAQRAQVDPFFAAIRAMEKLSDLQREGERANFDADGNFISFNPPADPLDILDATADMNAAFVELIAQIQMGKLTVSGAIAQLTALGKQAGLSDKQIGALVDQFNEVYATANNIVGADVATALGDASDAFDVRHAEDLASALREVDDASSRVAEAHLDMAEAFDQSGQSARDAAGDALTLWEAETRLFDAIKQNPDIILDLRDDIEMLRDKGALTADEFDELNDQLDELAERADISVQVDIKTTNLDLLNNLNATLKLNLDEAAMRASLTNAWNAVINALAEKYGAVPMLTTDPSAYDYLDSAKGNIIEYARGGVTPAHITGQQRMKYGEPQTGGEAFIPRYGDPSRSLGILQTAAGWYGADLAMQGQQIGHQGNVINVTVPAGSPAARDVRVLRMELESAAFSGGAR